MLERIKVKSIRNPKVVQAKARKNIVEYINTNLYKVTSGSSGQVYSVRVNGDCATCNCNWGYSRQATDKRSGCSHVVSVFAYIAAEVGRTVAAWGDEAQAEKQKRPTMDIGDGVILTSRNK